MIKAIVTGHSKGLGAALAADLLGRGTHVLGISRSAGAAPASAVGAILTEISLDMADTAALGFWLGGDALRDWLADADTVLLINNAGTVQPVGPLASQDPLEVARAVAINVAAPLMLSAALVQAVRPAPPAASSTSAAGQDATPIRAGVYIAPPRPRSTCTPAPRRRTTTAICASSAWRQG